MYKIKSAKQDYILNLPTTIDEVLDTVNKVLTPVNVAPNYTVLAVVYKTSLFSLASTAAGSKDAPTINILPIIAKTSIPDNANEAIKDLIKINHIPVIAPSCVERGHHLNIPIGASMLSVMNYLSKDNELRVALYQKKYKGNLEANDEYNIIKTDIDIQRDNNTPVYIISFKIVPNNDIVASLPIDTKAISNLDNTVVDRADNKSDLPLRGDEHVQL